MKIICDCGKEMESVDDKEPWFPFLSITFIGVKTLELRGFRYSCNDCGKSVTLFHRNDDITIFHKKNDSDDSQK